VKTWGIYVAASAVLAGMGGAASSLWLQPDVRSGVWAGLGAAWAVQVVAFALLLLVAHRGAGRFLAGWTAGTVLRVAALCAVAWLLLSGRWSLPAEPTLLALASGLFFLLLLEPLVFGAKARAG
jgi:hypothetical protein